jgi:glycine/D-amino acid oxidase-like deaminating enzyme
MYRPLDDPAAMPQTSYVDTAPTLPEAPPLTGELRTDICIVGAGITGLSAALHAAKVGTRVVVVEANAVGWGSSGRSFGQVVPYLRHEPQAMLRHFGQNRGERLIQAAAQGTDLVFELIERYSIPCQAVRNGLIFGAHTPRGLDRLRRRATFWQSRGIELPVLDARATADAIGGGNYWGALIEPRGGTINSLAYTRGLASAACMAGTMIHGGSRASSLTREGVEWCLRTPRGIIRADQILICTNAYTNSLWPGLGRSLIPVRAYQLATIPVPDDVRRTILPNGRALTDTRLLISGVRLHSNGHLHVSGDGPFFGPEQKPDYRVSTRRLLTLFPQLREIHWAFYWSGWLAMTGDEIPHLHALAPGVLAGLGYSGRGLALATLMGRELAKGALGTPAKDLLLPTSTPSLPRHIPFPAVARAGVRALAMSYRLRDRIDLARYGRGPHSPSKSAA